MTGPAHDAQPHPVGARGRLTELQDRLDHIGERTVGEQAEILELVHRSLVAELDDLLDETDGARSGPGAR